ncbi:MAG: hypothetical protein ACRCVE_13485 [Plesiomonas sp.]
MSSLWLVVYYSSRCILVELQRFDRTGWETYQESIAVVQSG